MSPSQATARKIEYESTLDLVHAFDASKDELAESVTIDKQGNIYVSLLWTGEIRKFTPKGMQCAYAVLPVGEPRPDGGVLGGRGALAGLTVDHTGNLYASLVSTIPEAKGIWKVTPRAANLVANLPEEALPNGIALDPHGNIYVADSALGLIWRVPAGGNVADVWIQDSILAPRQGSPFPGANGIRFFRQAMYVTVSDTRLILRIPILPDGNPGRIEVLVEDIGGDEFAFDVHGNMYVTTDPFNTLVRVAPDGSQELLATVADGLDGPSSATFGTREGEKNVLYVTNLAFFSREKHPSLMKMYIGIPGAPLP